MIDRLLEAIADVEMWTQKVRERVVILAPVGTLALLFQEDMLNDCPAGGQGLAQESDVIDGLPKFSGHLFIEDESLTQIVVRSLITNRRVVVQL